MKRLLSGDGQKKCSCIMSGICGFMGALLLLISFYSIKAYLHRELYVFAPDTYFDIPHNDPFSGLYRITNTSTPVTIYADSEIEEDFKGEAHYKNTHVQVNLVMINGGGPSFTFPFYINIPVDFRTLKY